jgi:predicted GNAT superfamily acetyltransferase
MDSESTVESDSPGSRILIEIPTDIGKMKVEAPRLAMDYREATRSAFRHYLGCGYEVRGFMYHSEQSWSRYLLEAHPVNDNGR